MNIKLIYAGYPIYSYKSTCIKMIGSCLLSRNSLINGTMIEMISELRTEEL